MNILALKYKFVDKEDSWMGPIPPYYFWLERKILLKKGRHSINRAHKGDHWWLTSNVWQNTQSLFVTLHKTQKYTPHALRNAGELDFPLKKKKKTHIYLTRNRKYKVRAEKSYQLLIKNTEMLGFTNSSVLIAKLAVDTRYD